MAGHDLPEWAFFDFDGTLSDTEPFGIELDMPVYESFGIHPSPEEAASIAGTTGEESIPALFARHGLRVTPEEFYARRADDDAIYLEKPLALYPGERDLLDRLAAAGVRMAVVSTTRHDLVEAALRRLGIDGYFAFLVCGDDVARHKPDPEPYLRALELAGTTADRAVVVEDSPVGIASGRGAGMRVLGFSGSSVPTDVSGADAAFSSYGLLAHQVAMRDPEPALEDVRAYFSLDRFATDQTGCVVEEARRGHAVCSLELGERHRNGLGIVMGGAVFTLADFALAVASNVGGAPAVTVSSSIEYLSPAAGKRLTATADADRNGRTLGFYTVDVTDDLGGHVARVTATCLRRA